MIELERNGERIVEPGRELPVEAEVDVMVVGGGMAGVGAGIAAARAGCKTLLVERESMLGGLATAGLVNIPLDFVCGIGEEMFAALEKVRPVAPLHGPEKHNVLDRMVKASGCGILFHTRWWRRSSGTARLRAVIENNRPPRILPGGSWTARRRHLAALQAARICRPAR